MLSENLPKVFKRTKRITKDSNSFALRKVVSENSKSLSAHKEKAHKENNGQWEYARSILIYSPYATIDKIRKKIWSKIISLDRMGCSKKPSHATVPLKEEKEQG